MHLPAVSRPALRRWREWLRLHPLLPGYVGIVLLALLLRLLHLDDFFTADERLHWLQRSQMFLQAIQTGRSADTAIHLHPGVTTMWLGSLGILLRGVLEAWGLYVPGDELLKLALTRLPVALTNALGVLAGYALLRRMLPAGAAALAALFWAADPFIVAYSRILHVDALAMTFSTLALLAACVYWHHEARPRWLVLSAVCAALALLSKLPAVALLPVVGILGLQGMGGRRWGGVWPFALWGAVFVLTIVLVWPAVWADPLRVYDLLTHGFGDELTEPHIWGNFFLGQPVDDPGPLFYPVALVMRLTPWTFAGLLLLPLLVRRARAPLGAAQWRDVAMLVLLALAFLLVLSLAPKKFNRYLLPVFPALDVLAALGLLYGGAFLLRLVGERLRLGARPLRRAGRALLAALVVLVVGNAAWWHPYAIAYYNPLLGGTQAGARTFLIGWGEGLAQAADWLNQQPDITGVMVASTIQRGLEPYLRQGAYVVADPAGFEQVGYLVVYVRQVQQRALAPAFRQVHGKEEPLHVVRIHGVDYAWIYAAPLPIDYTVNADFERGIRLQGYGVDSSALRSSGVLTLTVQWRPAAPIDHNYMLFAHLLDASGQVVAQLDAPPAGNAHPLQAWQPQRYYRWQHPMPVPADLPPGQYWLALGLYDPDTFSRLSLRDMQAVPSAARDYQGSLVLPLRIE